MNKKTGLFIVFGLLLVCCCVTSIGAFIVFVLPKINPTPTPTPTVTITNTTGHSITPAPTTTGQTSRSKCTPMLSGSNIIYPSTRVESTTKTYTSLLDTFNDNQNMWSAGPLESEYSSTKSYIQNGTYCIDITAKRDVISRDVLDSQLIKNFEMSIDGFQSSGTRGADYDLVFRQQSSSNYYIFGINQNYQDFYFASMKDDDWTDIVENTVSEYIKIDGPNTMKVIANNDKFEFYINDNLVKSVTDTTFTTAGKLGPAVGLEDEGDNAVFEFDNFRMTVK